MSSGTFPRPQRPFFPPRENNSHDHEEEDARGYEQPATGRRGGSGGSSDPLMELARLIGQNDPFAPAPPRSAPRERYQPKHPSQQYEAEDRSQDRAPPVRSPNRDFSPAQDRYEPVRDDYSRREPPRFPFRPDYADTHHTAADEPSAYAHHDDYQQGEDLHQPAATDWHQDDYADPSHHDQAYSDQTYSNQAYSDQPYSDQAHADNGYAEDAHVEAHPHDEAYATVPGQAPAAYDGQYAEPGAYEDGYEYAEHTDSDDGTATAKRRNTTKIAIAVLGLAVFGSAAAFGYRTVFKGGVSGPVPLIRADTSPTRVTPSGDGSGKPINERLSEGSERTMQRYEEPMDMRDASRGGNAVLPGASGSIPSVGGYPAASPTGGASGATEPRRVRTVTIRADQGTAPAPERTAAPPPPQTRAAPLPPRQAAAPREAPPPRDTTQTATGSAGGAPMSIMPGAGAAEEAPTRVATAAPPQTRSSEGGGGGYVVQLSAQKTESEAQASFRAMQSKFSALNGQQALIRRKDQGERGVFYAAQVGPFGSRDEANQLCESLKSAGGSCFVLRN
jgi:cell division septation protein DedD